MDRKLISVCVPVYNEEKNIRNAYERITTVMETLTPYDYEIIFFNDGSTDASGSLITDLSEMDTHVKAVFYTRNFGYSKNVFYCMQQAQGDAAILVHCDLQNPPEVIPFFVEKWEQGADAVLGIKHKSRENRFFFFLRSACYYLANLLFGMGLIPQATEFELLDKSLISVLLQVEQEMPFLRGLILEYAKRIAYVQYTQERRTAGKSHFNTRKIYEFAALGLVSMSNCIPRRLIMFSIIGILVLLIESIVFFVRFAGSSDPALLINSILLRCGVFLLLLLLLSLGIGMEYLIRLYRQQGKKPLIVEDQRIGFDRK